MESKKCSKCKLVKPISEWGLNKKQSDGLQTCCKECTRQLNNKRYKESQSHRDRIKNNNKNTRIKNKKNVWNYLLEHPCVDCGESDPVVLEFDHLRDKEFIISRGVSVRSWDSIQNEILKCEVRCANCHRRKTSKQFGHYCGE
jgi:hypothetical protein